MSVQDLKGKLRQELIGYGINVIYLTLVFGAFTMYRRLLLAAHDISYANYGVALIEALILGKPVFDATAPRIRVLGRRISNGWANIETLWAGIGDSLYGFRVYPIRPLLDVMEAQLWMRRFDFDVEAAVRLVWRGVRPINIPAPVKYFRPEEGGVSHFNYVRDNALLSWMHTRLFLGFLVRLPQLIVRRLRGGRKVILER